MIVGSDLDCLIDHGVHRADGQYVIHDFGEYVCIGEIVIIHEVDVRIRNSREDFICIRFVGKDYLKLLMRLHEGFFRICLLYRTEHRAAGHIVPVDQCHGVVEVTVVIVLGEDGAARIGVTVIVTFQIVLIVALAVKDRIIDRGAGNTYPCVNILVDLLIYGEVDILINIFGGLFTRIFTFLRRFIGNVAFFFGRSFIRNFGGLFGAFLVGASADGSSETGSEDSAALTGALLLAAEEEGPAAALPQAESANTQVRSRASTAFCVFIALSLPVSR